MKRCPITSFVPPNSIRWDRQYYKKEDCGDRFNKYAFSNDLVLEDITTINFNAGGHLKIISFMSRQKYHDSGTER